MNDTIRDCQISSFMSPNASRGASQARPSALGWVPHVRSGSYGNFRYVTVLFGSLKRLNRISIYSEAGANRVTCLNVYKTMDGRSFSFVETHSIEKVYIDNIAMLMLDRTIVSRGVRIGICGTTQTADSQINFKFDLFGCNASDLIDSQPFDACQLRDFVDQSINRSVLILNDSMSTLFYCDFMPSSDTTFLTGRNKCFRTNSVNTNKWQYLGPQVSNILGFDTDTNTVFGSTDGLYNERDVSQRGIVFSNDLDNDTAIWISCNPSVYHEVMSKSNGSLIEARIIEWKLLPGLFEPPIRGQSCAAFIGVGNWSICYDGIYYAAERVLDWNKCHLCDI